MLIIIFRSKTLPQPTNIRKVNFLAPPDHWEFATETFHATMSIVATGTPSVAQNLYQGLMELGMTMELYHQSQDVWAVLFSFFSLYKMEVDMNFEGQIFLLSDEDWWWSSMSAEDSKFFAESRGAACTLQRWTGYQYISISNFVSTFSSKFTSVCSKRTFATQNPIIGDGRSTRNLYWYNRTPYHKGQYTWDGGIGIDWQPLAVELGEDQITDHRRLLTPFLP